MNSRDLNFSGTYNTRDLGGIPTKDGLLTRMHSLVRSDSIDYFAEGDWDKLEGYGIRTIIDLRGPDECHRHEWPSQFRTIQIPLDGGDDTEFWNKWRKTGKWATPLYYQAHLERFPELTALVLRAVASAAEGGVLFHCGAGRDRTGLIAMVILYLVGVEANEIADDHSRSHENLSRFYEAQGQVDERIRIQKMMAESGMTVADVIDQTLANIKLEHLLLANGCSKSDLDLVRSRLI